MNAPLAVSTRTIADHPWVAQTHVGTDGVLLVLSADGWLALRGLGRVAMLDEIRSTLDPWQYWNLWRVLDAPAMLTLKAIDALLASPRPESIEVVNEREHDGIWTLDLRLQAELISFDDHFAQAPVVPGVLQVGWAIALAASRLGTSLHCRDMEALKFQYLLRPGDRLVLTLRLDAVSGKLHFAYHMDGRHCSSGRLRIGTAP
jgi:3-hydroxymyristoyl/3-hydroxydecanoyl-(acyl carrier protein) dehydratase